MLLTAVKSNKYCSNVILVSLRVIENVIGSISVKSNTNGYFDCYIIGIFEPFFSISVPVVWLSGNCAVSLSVVCWPPPPILSIYDTNHTRTELRLTHTQSFPAGTTETSRAGSIFIYDFTVDRTPSRASIYIPTGAHTNSVCV